MKPPSSKPVATPTGILLAAGKGLRFDPTGAHNKLLTPMRQGPEIGLPVGFVAARRMRLALSRVIAVVDADAPQREALSDWLVKAGCEVVATEQAAEGMGASLATAIQASLGGEGSPLGWIVGLADMPMIAPATIQAITAALTTPESLVAPVFEGQRGHPVGIGSAHSAALLALQGDVGARSLLDAHGFTAVDTGDAGVVRDIDQDADLDL